MVVTVKYNNLPKIILISLAAVLLLTLGILIGIYFFAGTAETDLNEYQRGGHGHRHMMMERRR
jgi:hypothetical protein